MAYKLYRIIEYEITIEKEKGIKSLTFICFLVLFLSLSVQAREESPSQMSRISGDWPTSLQPLVRYTSKHSSHLIIAIKHSEAYLDLRSAEHLRQSLLASPLSSWTSDNMGHIMFGWRCPLSKTPWPTGFTSLGGESNGQFTQLLLKGWGLSLLSLTLQDGYLNNPVENNDEFIYPSLLKRNRSLSFLMIEVAPQACDQTIDFVKKFSGYNQPEDVSPYKSFGFSLNPEKLEGGVCTTFAISALNKAGFFGRISPLFLRELKISSQLMGRKKQLPPFVRADGAQETMENDVSIFNLISKNWNSGTSMKSVFLPDTEMILLMLRSLFNQMQLEFPHKYKFENPFNRFIRSTTQILWRNQAPQKIDKNFDFVANQVVQESENYYNNLRRLNSNFNILKIENQFGIVISK